MKTQEDVREELRNTDMGKLLVRYGFEPYDTESAARRVAEKAAADISKLVAALETLEETAPIDILDNTDECLDDYRKFVRRVARAALEKTTP